MPLGFERLNARVSQPNVLLNFIRPLPGPGADTSKEFLERIAAQCYPVMKKNHVAVMALEEYPWNTEFIGRNFNAGEVIQLVLRGKSGNWLPFKHVQMVMMHELAHCKEMNHSKGFWKVRGAYCVEMRGLWDRGYTGEGLWGRGRSALTGQFVDSVMPDAAELPEHTCGGMFRTGGRKRKRGTGNTDKPKVSYAERQQKRILKKFGTGGVQLGDDEDIRVKLEEGKKKPKGKPRVAGSARGRELRAAAALARFDQATKEEVKKEELESASETEDEYEWPLTDDEATPNQTGIKVTDAKGHNMVRVCDVEDEDDDNVKQETQDLLDLDKIPTKPAPKQGLQLIKSSDEDDKKSTPEKEDAELAENLFIKPAKAPKVPQNSSIATKAEASVQNKSTHKSFNNMTSSSLNTSKPKEAPAKAVPKAKLMPAVTSRPTTLPVASATTNTCPCCSFANDQGASICTLCSNVLDTIAMPNHWRCRSDACRGGEYMNMGDYGICQICGERKP